MKIINEHTSYYRIVKEFEIETDAGEELSFCKYGGDSDDGSVDSDYDFTDESKVKFDAMPEEEQERIIDFIGEIKL